MALIAEKGKEIQDKEKAIIKKVVPIVFVVLAIVLIWKFSKAIVTRIKENQYDKNGGSQLNQWVNRFQVALHGDWYNEDEEACYTLAKEIGTKKMFSKVSSEYKKKYQITLEDDLVKYFSTSEIQKVYSFLK